MNRSLRGRSIGLLSGAIASTALIATLHDGPWSLLLGSAIGVAYFGSLRPTRRAYADNLMAGGSLGVPLWCLISVIAVPLAVTDFAALIATVQVLSDALSQPLQPVKMESRFGPPPPLVTVPNVTSEYCVAGGAMLHTPSAL